MVMLLLILNELISFLIIDIIKMLGDGTIRQSLLIEDNEQLTVSVTDRIYYQAFQFLQICNWMGFIYTIIKIVATPVIIIKNEFSRFTIFLISLLVVSFLQMIYYCKMRMVFKDERLFYEIAEQTGHITHVPSNQLTQNAINSKYRTIDIHDLTDTQNGEDERKMKDLSTQIRYIIHTQNANLNQIYRIQFAAYQVVHIWALLLLLLYQFPNQTDEDYVAVLVLLGTYQYLEFYILVIFSIIILPFYAIKKLYIYTLNRYKAFKIQRSLKSYAYNNNIKGDQQCKICLMPYEQNDKIVILKCSELHNFHASCFSQWANNSFTCPLCRYDITN